MKLLLIEVGYGLYLLQNSAGQYVHTAVDEAPEGISIQPRFGLLDGATCDTEPRMRELATLLGYTVSNPQK